jgi:hypothetical protein
LGTWLVLFVIKRDFTKKLDFQPLWHSKKIKVKSSDYFILKILGEGGQVFDPVRHSTRLVGWQG